MGGDAESTRTGDYVGIRELAPSRSGQRRVRETDGTRLHNVILSDVHSPAARARTCFWPSPPRDTPHRPNEQPPVRTTTRSTPQVSDTQAPQSVRPLPPTPPPSRSTNWR